MPISFATVPLGGLPEPDEELQSLLSRWWHRHGIREFDHPAYAVGVIDHLPIPTAPEKGCPELGVLCWPGSASRWGTFSLLVTGTQLAAVRAAAPTGAGTLLISDGATPLSAFMSMLPARPVCQKDGNDLYLLSLVDDRYFWWMSGDEQAPAAPASWAALLGALFTSVGQSPSLPTVPAAYGTPDVARWNLGYVPLPLLIDAACATIGLRTTLTFSGTAAVLDYAAAVASDDSQWGAHQYEVLTGGRFAASEVGASVPAAVAVVFPGATPAVTTNTLAGLALSGYGTATGVADAVGRVGADLPATAASGDRTAYAAEASASWYNWQLALTDATFRCIVSWTPTGLEDRIEWRVRDDGFTTTVFRPPFADRGQWGGASAAAAAASSVWLARLSAVDGSSNWKWYKRKLDGSTPPDYTDDGSESAGFTAIPAKIDGVSYANPVAGLRVVMWESAARPGYQEFLPIGMTDATHPGLVNIDTTTPQVMGNGDKTFQRAVTTNSLVGNYKLTVKGDNTPASGSAHANEFLVDPHRKEASVGTITTAALAFATPTVGDSCFTVGGIGNVVFGLNLFDPYTTFGGAYPAGAQTGVYMGSDDDGANFSWIGVGSGVAPGTGSSFGSGSFTAATGGFRWSTLSQLTSGQVMFVPNTADVLLTSWVTSDPDESVADVPPTSVNWATPGLTFRKGWFIGPVAGIPAGAVWWWNGSKWLYADPSLLPDGAYVLSVTVVGGVGTVAWQ